jgi:hypothetical protein
VRLNVQLSCDLANVLPAATDAFKASADRLFNAALERVKELAAAYAGAAESARRIWGIWRWLAGAWSGVAGVPLRDGHEGGLRD